jgi:biotin/methionine sulfoxide reductase
VSHGQATGDEDRTSTATHWGNYTVVRRGGRVIALEPAPYDPSPSPIGPGMASTLRHRARIVEPMVRKGWLLHGPRRDRNARGSEPFVPVSWERAFELLAVELERVRTDYDNAAIYGSSGGWGSAGRFHHAQSQVHRFLNLLGGYTSSVNSYSAGAMEVILPHVVGGSGMSILKRGVQWESIAADGELVVAFGGMNSKNTQANSGGNARHESRTWPGRCAAAGVQFVNVGPFRSDIDTDLTPEWIPIRPNTDVAFMLGMAHTLLREGLHDIDFLRRCCIGFERFAAYLVGTADGQAKDAAWAARITDTQPEIIRDLARRIATRRTTINAGLSLQRADHGEQVHWMAITLAAMSGSMGRPGGGFQTALGVGQIGSQRDRHSIAALPQGTNPVADYIPVARVTDMLLAPGATIDYNGTTLRYPDIRLIYWIGGNPFHHQQDLNRLVRAWQRPETIVTHESWWNPLARFSDIVLPVATALERNDFAAGQMDLTISAMHKAADPPPGVRTDYDIFSEVADRLGFGAAFTQRRTAEQWVRALYDETRHALGDKGVTLPPFDDFWQRGHCETPPPNFDRDEMAALRDDPGRSPLPTPSGRLEIFSSTIAGFGYTDCPGHPSWIPPAEWLGAQLASRFPLHLLSNQPATRLHSQYDHGDYSQAGKVAGREPMRINPGDARHRSISSGDLVRVFNDRGACVCGAVVTDAIAPGVVQISTGAWYDPVEPGTPGSLERHGNPNVLTLDKGSSKLAQASIANTALVEVERLDEDPGPVKAYDPPSVERIFEYLDHEPGDN